MLFYQYRHVLCSLLTDQECICKGRSPILLLFFLFDSLFSSNWKKRQPTPQLGSLRCDSEKTHGCLSPADCLGWGCALPPALLWVSAAHPRREPRPHPRARGSPGSAEPARPSPRAPQCRWCSGISRPRRGPCGPGTHSPCGPLTAPRPRAGSTRSPSPGRRRYRPSERRVPVRGRAPPRSEHRLLPAGPQDAGGSGASASGAAGLSGSPRPAPSEPPSPLPRPAPLRGWAGRRHPPASGTSSRRRGGGGRGLGRGRGSGALGNGGRAGLSWGDGAAPWGCCVPFCAAPPRAAPPRPTSRSRWTSTHASPPRRSPWSSFWTSVSPRRAALDRCPSSQRCLWGAGRPGPLTPSALPGWCFSLLMLCFVAEKSSASFWGKGAQLAQFRRLQLWQGSNLAENSSFWHHQGSWVLSCRTRSVGERVGTVVTTGSVRAVTQTGETG